MKLTKIADDKYMLETPLMRSNSRVSDKSWIAEIVGRNPKFRYERKFCERTKHPSGVIGTQDFIDLRTGVIYEYRDLCGEKQSAYSYASKGGNSGFFVIENNELKTIEESDVLKLLESSPAMK